MRAAITSIALAVAIAGCGYKGPLVAPKPKPAAQKRAAPPAPAPDAPAPDAKQPGEETEKQ